MTDALGTTTYTYDQLDRQIVLTDPLGKESTYTYDSFVTSGSDPFVTRSDGVTDALDNVTTSSYDVFGRLMKVTSVMDVPANNIETTYEYDKNGNQTFVTDGEGDSTTYAYDFRDRLWKSTHADNTTVEFTLDAMGKVMTSKDQLDNETDSLYDDLGRLLKTTYADNTTVELTRDAIGRLEMMVGMTGIDIPIWTIRRQIASAIHIVIQVSRLMGGARKVIKVSEITGMEGEIMSMHDIFEFRQTGLDEQKCATGHFHATGIRPHFLDRLEACGIGLPIEMFERRILDT